MTTFDQFHGYMYSLREDLRRDLDIMPPFWSRYPCIYDQIAGNIKSLWFTFRLELGDVIWNEISMTLGNDDTTTEAAQVG